MSLDITDFDQYALASARIDYTEIRLGEQKAIYFNFFAADGVTPIDVTSWTFTTSYYNAMGTFNEGATTLNTVTNVTLLNPAPMTDPALVVNKITPTAGQTALLIPSSVTNAPTSAVPLTGQNTLLKLIKINATYAVSGITPTFNAIDEYFLGVIIRFA